MDEVSSQPHNKSTPIDNNDTNQNKNNPTSAPTPSPPPATPPQQNPGITIAFLNMHEEWGEGVDFPAFNIEVRCDEKERDRIAGLVVVFRLVDGFGNLQDHLLQDKGTVDERTLAAPTRVKGKHDNGSEQYSSTLNISSLRFCRVSSKHGGTFTLLCVLVRSTDPPNGITSPGSPADNQLGGVPPKRVSSVWVGGFSLGGVAGSKANSSYAPVVSASSPPIRVVCRRNFDRFSHHKTLRGGDAVSKMGGVGEHYARRFSDSNVFTIADLARVVPDSSAFEDLFASVRQVRGRLTRERLTDLISTAKDIVKSDNDNNKSTTANTTSSSTPPTNHNDGIPSPKSNSPPQHQKKRHARTRIVPQPSPTNEDLNDDKNDNAGGAHFPLSKNNTMSSAPFDFTTTSNGERPHKRQFLPPIAEITSLPPMTLPTPSIGNAPQQAQFHQPAPFPLDAPLRSLKRPWEDT